jgi:TRAP-type C4-dicarboxylate transport system permease small subunit
MISKVTAALQLFAERVAAALLAVIFVAFIIQIALRYVFNWPVGWTAEVSVVAWLWLVLWGAAFVLKDHEEIRIDFVIGSAGPRTRRVLGILASASIVVLFAMSLPAAYSYVSFMKVEKSSYLNIRFDVLFSIYIVFSVALIARNLWALGRLLSGRGQSDDDTGTTGTAS